MSDQDDTPNTIPTAEVLTEEFEEFEEYCGPYSGGSRSRVELALGLILENQALLLSGQQSLAECLVGAKRDGPSAIRTLRQISASIAMMQELGHTYTLGDWVKGDPQ